MKSFTTITISLPKDMGDEIQKIASEEQRTVSELMRESFRQYKAKKHFRALAKKTQAVAKKKGLKPEDL